MSILNKLTITDNEKNFKFMKIFQWWNHFSISCYTVVKSDINVEKSSEMNELAEISESELKKLDLKQDNNSDTFILVNDISEKNKCEKNDLKISSSDNSFELFIV